MSTATEIGRLTDARNTIRDKLIELGLAVSTDKLDTLATAIDGIANRGSVSATVQEGDTYTIPAGYHNGSGTVSGVAGGGNYSLQEKTVTPTKNQQTATPDSGYYGLSDVIINPIPEAYQNVSSVTATASEVLAGKVIVNALGENITGIMTNNGAVSKKLDATTGNQSYTVPGGYHSGSGSVYITLESKSAIPSTASQDITPTSGKVLNKVTVAAIPSAYQNVTGVTASAADVLSGQVIVSSTGSELTGTMTNNGTVTSTLDVSHTSYTIPAGYHNGSGAVNIVTETKTTTPTTSTQSITPTSGKVLSKVTVNAIPSKFADTTNDDAVASNLLSGKTAHTYNSSTGAAVAITGSMTNNGAVSSTLDSAHTSYTIPTGFHNGSGAVSIVTEDKSVTPSTAAQTVVASSGKVLSYVSVAAIPSAYQDVTQVTAVAADVVSGKKFVASNGSVITGSMTDNGTIATQTLSTTSTVYTIPAGKHSGSGKVQIVLETKSATPSTVSQNITPTSGKVLSKVTVNAIPSEFQNVTGVTASAADVLSGQVIVSSTGEELTGTMANNGTVTSVLSVGHTSYTIPSGYHSGSGTVSITTETKTATPSAGSQTISATTGKVISSFTVNAIPTNWGNTTGDTGTSADVLAGVKVHSISNGAAVLLTGTMPNNGTITGSIDGLTTTSYSIASGYTSGGTVSLTSDIETALSAI